MQCKVEVSARHIHLSQKDFEILFGKESPIEFKKLGQNQFSCEEFVTLSGPKGKIDKVRLVAPLREQSQVEISRTDAIKIGVDAPLKLSGDLPGAEIKVLGSKGEIDGDIAIVAKRHIHLSPDEASKLNLKEGDLVKCSVDSERALVFGDIIARVSEVFSESIHLDTDEANAAGISGEIRGELII